MKKHIIIVVLAAFIAACGGDGPVNQPQSGVEGVAPMALPSEGATQAPVIDSRAKYWEPIIRSEDYTGQVAVMFKESAGVRLNSGSPLSLNPSAGMTIFRSRSNADITALNALFAQHSEAAVQMGLPNITQDELDQRIAEIRVSEGYPMTDWASFYIVNVMDADETLEILSALYQSPNLWFAHPIPRAYPAGIQVPNISPGPGQDYLKDTASTGGLNVKAAWDAGLDGTGIVVRDFEVNWNTSHLDLPTLTMISPFPKGGSSYKQSLEDKFIQHGTAVAGVLVGKDNGTGITGIAPQSKLQITQYDIGALTELIKNQAMYADSGSSPSGNGINADPHLKPGDILLIERQTMIPNSQPDCGASDQNPSNGCSAYESMYTMFLAFKELTNYGGLVVVEAAANGGINLDDPKNQAPKTCAIECGQVDFSKGDNSGAIMVGASMGGSTLLNGKHTLEKAPFSNCGNRVDVFAWGKGVVTTGYGTHPISVKNDPNQWYANDFGGTSSATAIIAGSAALLQQYAKQLYKDPKSACAIKSWEYIYLSSQQMRDVMVKSGTAPKLYTSDPQLWNNYKDPNPGCNIGTQPDLAKAMQIIKDGCDGKLGGIKATVKTKDLTTYCPKSTLQNPNPKKESWCPDYGPLQPAIGKMMDLDGDGRADLISFSKDRKWYVDLSSTGPTQFSGMTFPKGKPKDNFGYWDLIFDLSNDTTIAKDAMLFPVVMDYNTDGKADLGLYDSIHGKWYVSFTNGNTLNTKAADVTGNVPFPGWTMTLDYTGQPHWKPYSRPVPGDYDGQDKDPYTFDHYMDLALQTPDGWWLIDFGGASTKANYGSFDKMVEVVDDGVMTYAQFNGQQDIEYKISNVPAWAYLPVVYMTTYGYENQSPSVGIEFKSPDDVGDPKQSNHRYYFSSEKKVEKYLSNADYGSNDVILAQAKYQTKSYADLGIKQQCSQTGFWAVATDQSNWADIIYIDPYVDFGDLNCRPIPGDYDGDGYDDRAVQCGNTWNIAYTGSTYPINVNTKLDTIGCDGKSIKASQTFRSISEPAPQDPLPGYVYPGGVSFKDIKEIFSAVNYLCPTVKPTGNEPPCSLLNMTPVPIGPFFPQCVDAVRKTYAADTCTNPAKKVTCEQMRVKQAQCVYQH